MYYKKPENYVFDENLDEGEYKSKE